MGNVYLNLVVIRSADPARSREFYEALGLRFIKEQHGSGPEHYACEAGNMVLEIYPRANDKQSSSATRLGFRVPSVDGTTSALVQTGATVVTAPTDSPWGRRAVVLDPDGHRVELTEHPK